MSLFGGEESPREPSPSQENESQDSEGLPLSATQSSVDSFEAAENAQTPTYNTIDSDSDDDQTELPAESEEEFHVDELDRPNRFTGKPSTWKGYTETERQTAASLAQIESGDLAAHLYNAHALKRRVRLPQNELNHGRTWKSKESWMKKGEDLEVTDIVGDVQTELVPSKRWTAWPMPAQDVPGPNEKFWRQRGAEGTAQPVGSVSAQVAGTELREEILGMFLRLSKEKWTRRKTADDSQASQDEVDKNSTDRSRSRPKNVDTQQLETLALDPDQDNSESEMQESELARLKDEYGSQSESERKFAHLFNKKKRGRKASPQSVKATVLADDDRARRLLQPTINSLLTRVDDLASGIRRARMNHFGRGAYSDTSGSEAFSDGESIRTRSRSRSTTRAKSIAARNHVSKKLKRRPREAQPLEDDDSGSDFGAESGLERPGTGGSSEISTPRGRRARSKSGPNESSLSAERNPIAQSGQMDWSEVLGIASMTGWDERVIARTAQRCASLFGEGMTFRSFNENLATGSIPEPVHYTPSTIPGPEILGISRTSKPKRPLFDTGTLRCPHTDCWGHKEDFPIPYRVVEHVKRVHGYDPRTNNADNEERKYGGVHIDGFLQPITAKQGWMGRGRSKSKSREPRNKRRRVMRESEPSSPIVAVSSPS